ncbi:MAG: sensor domain-containing diguanylate cyclase [Deltaproteobacteria bacterium]|nr:sensor domain-containing diguanylate cyclase [Deltaproteobacteria bacterium]
MSTEKKLLCALDTLSLINSTLDTDVLLDIILRSIKQVMEVEASSIMLLDPEKGDLYFSKAEGGSKKVKEVRLHMGEGIAGQVAQTGLPMIVNDVSKSTHFAKKVDEFTKFKTKAILAVPLKVKGKVTGVLEALNKMDGSDFNDEDLLIFTSYGNQIAVALENAHLYHLAIYDGLTGIFDKRYFQVWAENEFARVKRYHTDLSLVMFDLDHFKNINDSYGHRAGDFILKEITSAVKSIIRRADIFARIGGEEFIIALPETNVTKARLMAEKIRKAVELMTFTLEGNSLKTTISLGVVSYDKTKEPSFEKLLHDVDQALYESKNAGRNKYTVYHQKGHLTLKKTG